MTKPKTPITGTETFRLDELQKYYKNPRQGDINAIAESLKINGQYRPIVVNIGSKTGRPLEILAGNHTFMAAKKLGWDTIAATTVDVDDLAAARITVADNRTADLGDYNDELLAQLLQDVMTFAETLDGTGYDASYLDDLLDGIA